MANIELTEDILNNILAHYSEDKLHKSSAYSDGGVEGINPRFNRAVTNQMGKGDATLSRYAIWANTVRDNIIEGINQVDNNNPDESKKYLIRAANALSAFSDVQAYFDPFKHGNKPYENYKNVSKQKMLSNNSESRDKIAFKITQMISYLHIMGYENLYLHSGWSPNGVNWRYEIGVCESECWPVDSPILSESITHGSALPWCGNSESMENMAAKFISTYLIQLPNAKIKNSDYVEWFQLQLTSLNEDTPLILFADCDYEYYQELLSTAPGYKKDVNKPQDNLNSLDIDNFF